MARASCKKCCRPIKGCLCHFFVHIQNVVKLVLLQHPNEVNHPKGTATLLEHSLVQFERIVDENINQNSRFQTLLKEYQGRIYVLYPSDEAKIINTKTIVENELANSCLIVIDATWKKAYKMYQLSTLLHQLPLLKLPAGIEGEYSIRSTTKRNALSSLEASCHALAILENDLVKYQPLLNNFIQFNHFHLSFKQSHS